MEPFDPEPSDLDSRNCPHCDRVIPVGYVYCGFCGGRLVDEGKVSDVLKNMLGKEGYRRYVELKKSSDAESVTRGSKRGGCPHCGTAVSVGWIFCGACGKSVPAKEVE
jgi:hypothetical protein